MANPEEFVVGARIAAEALGFGRVAAAEGLPGLVELAGPASKVAGVAARDTAIAGETIGLIGTRTTSLLEPANRALITEASALTGNPVPGIVLRAAESSGVPLAVPASRITALSDSLASGSVVDVEAALSQSFRPRTYAEMMAYYGG